jgi:multidrug resistance efflux pump
VVGVLLGASGFAALGIALSVPQPGVGGAPPPAKSEPPRIRGIGYVEPVTEVRRLMFRSSGVIEASFVAVGQRMREGEILMRLDRREEEAAAAVAEAELELARAECARTLSGVNPARIVAAERQRDLAHERREFADKTHTRLLALRTRSSTSQQELDDAETALRQAQQSVAVAEAEVENLKNFVRKDDELAARAAVRLAEAKVHSAQQRLETMILRAPCDGTVLEILLHPGEGTHVLQPQPALLFADVSRLRIRAEIDERQIQHIRSGQSARITGPALAGASFAGRVDQIKQIMGPRTLFSDQSSERKDLRVLQLFILPEAEFRQPVGLQVDVEIRD